MMSVPDFCKRFNPVSHRPLIKKLRKIGLDDYLLQSYLINTTKVVVADGECSEELSVMSGVPQGSVLGLLLDLPCLYK